MLENEVVKFKKIDRLDESEVISYTISRTGRLSNYSSKKSYICPKCFKSITIDTSIENLKMVATADAGGISFRPMGMKYNTYCSDCDEFMFECDEKLVDLIIAMNKNGFITLYCCEGHYNSEDGKSILFNDYFDTFSMPYIYFYRKDDDEDTYIDDIKKLIESDPEYKKYIFVQTGLIEDIDENETYYYTTATIRSKIYDVTGKAIWGCSDLLENAIAVEDFNKSQEVFLKFVSEFIHRHNFDDWKQVKE